ncbi:MAG: asparagine synthase (glutamine-hydrolyzing) [Kiritimatiellae bacterium]|nr:asparagine synthase (glutamine-hydrolyzing) [Kiritimatiellia bacterium]
MCGICGYVSGTGLSNGRETVLKMIATLAHRGPDQQGELGDEKVRLGFCRLAILDLSHAGDQPMRDETGEYCITLNGEVFNYVELREQLKANGHEFRSTSDSEVALKAYMEWGTDCFRKFRGMWALSIWDKPRNRVVFARDYFGIKPLYFCHRPEGLFWASEIKAFDAAFGPLEENRACAFDYVVYGLLDHTDQTLFKDVYQLRPGEMAVSTEGTRLQRQVYWNLETALPEQRGRVAETDAIDRFRSLLLRGIDISLRSDVPVWILLSGGLDSSSIVSIVRHLYPDRAINTISVVHEDPAINEFEYVEAVARHTNCRVEKITIDAGAWVEELDALVYHQDEPVPQTTAVNHWHLMKALRQQGVKVILSGQGIDEILYGYVPIFMGYLFADLFAQLRWRRLWKEMKAHRNLREDWPRMFQRDFLLRMLKGFVPSQTARAFRARYLDRSEALIRGAVLHETRRRRDAYAPPRLAGLDLMRNAGYRMLTAESIPQILHYEDRNSMAFSIEQRVPFLDPDIVSLVFSLPAGVIVRDGRSKWILREALRGILPEKVRVRLSKLGFSTPESQWVASKEFQTYVQDQRLDTVLTQSIVDSEHFALRVKRLVAGKTAYSPVFWRVYNYALWKKRFRL